MYKNTNKNEKGAAILIAIILFLFISMTIILGMVNPILKQASVSKSLTVFQGPCFWILLEAL